MTMSALAKTPRGVVKPTYRPNGDATSDNPFVDAEGNINKFTLMRDDQYTASEEFKTSRISTSVRRDWFKNDQELLTGWLKSTEQFLIPESLLQTWNEMKEDYQIVDETRRKTMVERHHAGIAKDIQAFCVGFMPRGFSYDKMYRRATYNLRKEPNCKNLFTTGLIDTTNHRGGSANQLLPRAMATKLVRLLVVL